MADECERAGYIAYDLHAAERQIRNWRGLLDALKLERRERQALKDWHARKPTSRCVRRWLHQLEVEDARFDFQATLYGGMSAAAFARLHPKAVAHVLQDSIALSRWGQRWLWPRGITHVDGLQRG